MCWRWRSSVRAASLQAEEYDDAVWTPVLRYYVELPPCKAFAIDGSSGAHGYSYGMKSPQIAVERALAACRGFADDGGDPAACRLWAIGHRVIWGFPAEAVEVELQRYADRVMEDEEVDPFAAPGEGQLVEEYLWEE